MPPSLHRHLGIYGIVRQEDCLLLIKKARGPYTGQYDFPGGSMEHGESIETTLKREFIEEVNAEIQAAELFDTIAYTAEWTDQGQKVSTHHVGIYFHVELTPHSVIKTDADGHDSDGAVWVPKHEITSENISGIGYALLKKQKMI